MLRRPVLAGVVVVLALLVPATDVAVLAGRVGRLQVPTVSRTAGTWVVLGLDSRADLPAGAATADFGTTSDVPGARADVVVVLRETPEGLTAISVPRDVVVGTSSGPSRLALTWLQGPRSMVEGLCALGIPTGHLVTVDLAGFAAVVDAAGGIDVDVPEPVRDPMAGLDLPHAGRRHLDGATALAFVRSRHPEHLRNGSWVPAAVDPDGRALAVGILLRALSAAAHRMPPDPVRLQSMAWVASGALGVDSATTLREVAGVSGARIDRTEVLPVGAPSGTTLARLPTDATRAAVRAAGLSCTS